MITAVFDKTVAIDVAGRSWRALGYAVLVLLVFGCETALAAVRNLRVEAKAIQVTLRPTPPRTPFLGFPAVAVAGDYARRWQRASAEMQADLDVLAACATDRSGCSPTASRFIAIVEAGREKQGRARLGTVNRAINLAIQATSDRGQHGADDVWSSPVSTLRSGKGDCEDYAIAKFAALRLAGVPAQDLRLVIVRNLKMHGDHAVLAALFNDRWLILDNRRFLLVEDRQILSEYSPLVAFTLEPPVRTLAQTKSPQMTLEVLER